jgi:hypothetical protein
LEIDGGSEETSRSVSLVSVVILFVCKEIAGPIELLRLQAEEREQWTIKEIFFL